MRIERVCDTSVLSRSLSRWCFVRFQIAKTPVCSQVERTQYNLHKRIQKVILSLNGKRTNVEMRTFNLGLAILSNKKGKQTAIAQMMPIEN